MSYGLSNALPLQSANPYELTKDVTDMSYQLQEQVTVASYHCKNSKQLKLSHNTIGLRSKLIVRVVLSYK